MGQMQQTDDSMQEQERGSDDSSEAGNAQHGGPLGRPQQEEQSAPSSSGHESEADRRQGSEG